MFSFSILLLTHLRKEISSLRVSLQVWIYSDFRETVHWLELGSAGTEVNFVIEIPFEQKRKTPPLQPNYQLNGIIWRTYDRHLCHDPLTHISALLTQMTTTSEYMTFKGGSYTDSVSLLFQRALFPHGSLHFSAAISKWTICNSSFCTATAGSGSGVQRRSKLQPSGKMGAVNLRLKSLDRSCQTNSPTGSNFAASFSQTPRDELPSTVL